MDLQKLALIDFGEWINNIYKIALAMQKDTNTLHLIKSQNLKIEPDTILKAEIIDLFSNFPFSPRNAIA